MIITITLNPSVDLTYASDKLEPGILHRVTSFRVDPGGKGINTSLALHKFGISSTACGLIGGDTGRWIAKQIHQSGVTPSFTSINDQTRINTKIVEKESGQLTEFNSPGPSVSKADITTFTAHLLQLLTSVLDQDGGNHHYVIISGSIPPGVSPAFYATLVSTLQGYPNVRTVIDTGGDALNNALDASPFLIKPNNLEAESILGYQIQSRSSAVRAVNEFLEKGIRMVIISLGKHGAVVGCQDDRIVWWARSKPVTAKSTVGCGDTMVAAAVYGLVHGFTLKELAHLCVAAGRAAAMLPGTTFPSLNEVHAQLPTVTSAPLER